MQAKNLEELELQQPLFERTIRPLWRASRAPSPASPATSFTQTTEKRLALAGNPGDLRVADWLGIKAVGAIVGARRVRPAVRVPGRRSRLPVSRQLRDDPGRR